MANLSNLTNLFASRAYAHAREAWLADAPCLAELFQKCRNRFDRFDRFAKASGINALATSHLLLSSFKGLTRFDTGDRNDEADHGYRGGAALGLPG
ncbi:hypothetical protein CHELA40_14306 [Chelatococcus asaccharovorans]|nr:hypothetical protein CHELA40_14306 [Chelatococcus asaccharovorans]